MDVMKSEHMACNSFQKALKVAVGSWRQSSMLAQ